MTNCSIPKKPSNIPSVELPEISVNGVSIDHAVLSGEVQYHEAENLEAAIQKAGQALVIKELLRQQLPSADDAHDPVDEEQAFADLIAKHIKDGPISESDAYNYYEQNLEKFKTSPILEVSHILLSAAPDDVERRIEQKALADDLISRLKEEPGLFGEFVVEFSDCPSKETKGSLGQISNGQTVIEFERQLFVLPEGLHDKAIESRYGYHISYIHKKIEGKQLEFSMVEDQIGQYLAHRRYRQAIADYLYGLAEAADIRGINLQLDQENIHIG